MIKKVVDTNGAIAFRDGETTVAAMSAEVNAETRSVRVSLSGALRTDVQAYLDTELQFYEAANLACVELDCGGVTQIAPGCFKELLNMKIQMAHSDGKVIVNNKSECILGMERKTGKTL